MVEQGEADHMDPASPTYFIIVRYNTNDRTEHTGTYSIHKDYVHIREVIEPDGRHKDVIVPFSSIHRLTAVEQQAPSPKVDG